MTHIVYFIPHIDLCIILIGGSVINNCFISLLEFLIIEYFGRSAQKRQFQRTMLIAKKDQNSYQEIISYRELNV